MTGRPRNGHRRADRGSLAANICLFSGAVHADPLGGIQQAVTHEHIGVDIPIAIDEVIGLRHEGNEPAVSADRGIGCHTYQSAVIVSLTFVTVHAHALGDVREAIMHEHIKKTVRVAGYEVVGQGHKDDEATVAADRGHITEAVRSDTITADADLLCDSRWVGEGTSRSKDSQRQQDRETRSCNSNCAGIHIYIMCTHS